MSETFFEVDLSKNCLGEQVWEYHLARPVERDFEKYIEGFGKLIYPLGEGYSVIKLETKDFLLTGNVGLCELRLTIKRKAVLNIKEMFEETLMQYFSK